MIGEFKGPVDGDFGKDWAAFYECWAAGQTVEHGVQEARQAEEFVPTENEHAGEVISEDDRIHDLEVSENLEDTIPFGGGDAKL